jgi:hypothetical protein
MMTDTLPRVIVPYADFLERRDRRRKLAAPERPRPDDQGTIDVTAVSVSPAKPLSRDEKNQYDGPWRVKNPDRAT